MEIQQIVKRVVMKFGSNRPVQDREDFEQECQVAILENTKAIGLLEGKTRDRYVYIICKNRVIDYIRKEKPVDYLSEEKTFKDAERVQARESEIEQVLDNETISKMVCRLPEPVATVVALRYGIDCDHRTFEEIARRFQRSIAWVQKQEQKGLELLREMLNVSDIREED